MLLKKGIQDEPGVRYLYLGKALCDRMRLAMQSYTIVRQFHTLMRYQEPYKEGLL